MNKGFINIDSHSIYYEYINDKFQNNDSPLIIFLHHGVGSIKQWGNFPLLLSNSLQYPALLYDRYGYGMSEGLKESRETDYLNHEANVVLTDLIEKLVIKNKVILIGHSDGGSIALIYASLANSQLSGLITIAPHVFVEDCSIEGIRKTVVEYKQADALYRGLRKYHHENTETMFYGWADVWLSKRFRNWSIVSLLSAIKAPLLAIQGDKDEYGTLSQVEAIKKQVKNKITTMIIKDCGHSPHTIYKNEILELIRDFILKVLK